MLGEIIIAEPKAVIGFAGRRVIEQTLQEELPPDFQTAEYLHHHGLVDLIVHRHHLREAFSECIAFHQTTFLKKENLLRSPHFPTISPSGDGPGVSLPGQRASHPEKSEELEAGFETNQVGIDSPVTINRSQLQEEIEVEERNSTKPEEIEVEERKSTKPEEIEVEARNSTKPEETEVE